jgi:hypothetical protein
MLCVEHQATARERKQFFFEKKSQKTSAKLPLLYPERPEPGESSVSCFFFSRNQSFPLASDR